MISIGTIYGGPEFSPSSGIKNLLESTVKTLRKIRGPWVGNDDYGPCDSRPESGPFFVKGSAPSLNVVFSVSGSVADFGIAKIEVGRFSRKNQAVSVSVIVSGEEVTSGGSVDFVISALEKSIQIASEVFKKKKNDPFDIEKATSLLNQTRESLIEQGF